MVTRDELTQFIYDQFGKDLLEKAAKIDTVPNSLQLKGSETVKKVLLGVSANLEFFQQAVEEKADYLIFHHGLHLNGYVLNGRLDPFEDVLRLAFNHNFSVAGFHYALDAHVEIGNNAIIIDKLGAKRLNEPFFEEWGWVGEFKKPVSSKELAERCADLFQHDIFAVYAGPEKIKRIGVCSGGARPRGVSFYELIDKKIDALISGEISESGPYLAEAGKYHYFAGGHYATEVFGIQVLAGKIARHFEDKLEVAFIDIPSTL